MRYILFGDSIGFGVGDYQNGGWATQLRLLIDRNKKSKDHTLINLSISGDTSRGLVARMELEALLRMRNTTRASLPFLSPSALTTRGLTKPNPLTTYPLLSLSKILKNDRDYPEIGCQIGIDWDLTSR